jgi:hypothetical protein
MRSARADGRPLYYDIMPGSHVGCRLCELAQKHRAGAAPYGFKEGFLTDPANPPEGEEPGSVWTICYEHLPENAVIFNPHEGDLCRNKAGTLTWREGGPKIVRPDGRPI